MTSAPVVPGGVSGSGVVRPDLPADAVVVWERLAAEAVAAGTLTATTAFAFGELCKLVALQHKLLAEVEARGLTEVGLRLGTVYLAASRQLEAKMRGFRLAPAGKPLVADTKSGSALERLKEQRLRIA